MRPGAILDIQWTWLACPDRSSVFLALGAGIHQNMGSDDGEAAVLRKIGCQSCLHGGRNPLDHVDTARLQLEAQRLRAKWIAALVA